MVRDSLIDALRAGLRSHGSAEDGRAMQAYMKSEMPYVERHDSELSALSKREALKHLVVGEQSE